MNSLYILVLWLSLEVNNGMKQLQTYETQRSENEMVKEVCFLDDAENDDLDDYSPLIHLSNRLCID